MNMIVHRHAITRRSGPARILRRGTAAVGLSLAMVAALGLTGCGSDSTDTSSGTQSASASPGIPNLPEGWTYLAGTPDYSVPAIEPELPATVTDGAGIKVTVRDISKIIVAGDGIAAVLGALGFAGKIYGAPRNAVSPEAKAAAKKFDFSKETGAEGLLAVDGTLFIGDNVQRHQSVAKQFRDAGTDALVINDLQTLGEKIQAVAAAVGVPEAGVQLAKQVNAQLDEAKNLIAADHQEPIRIVEVTATGAGGQNSVAGAGTPGTEMIERIGAVSVGASAGLRGYSREMSNEGMLSEAPDIILLTVADIEQWGGADGLWAAFPTLQQTPAGQANKIYVMPDAQLKYPSPEIGAGAQALAKALAAS